MTEMAHSGLSGSTLQGFDENQSFDNFSSQGTLTKSMESLLLCESDMAGLHGAMPGKPDAQAIPVSLVCHGTNPGTSLSAQKEKPVDSIASTVDPGLNQEKVEKQIDDINSVDGQLTKRQRKRRNMREKKRAKMQILGVSNPSSSSSPLTKKDIFPKSLDPSSRMECLTDAIQGNNTLNAAEKRTRTDDSSLLMENLSGVSQSAESASKKRKKKRKVQKLDSKSLSSSARENPAKRGDAISQLESTPVKGAQTSSEITPTPMAGVSLVGQNPKSTQPLVPSGPQSYSDVASREMKVAIVALNGSGPLSKSQTDHISSHIWNAMGTLTCRPNFEGMRVEEGMIKIHCSNQLSLDWLTSTVSAIPTCEDCTFTIVSCSSLRRLVRITSWIPGNPRVKEVIARLRMQNEGLETRNWRVWSYKREGGQLDSLLVVGVDLQSLEVLRSKYGMRPYLNLGRISFRIRDEERD